MNLQFGVTCGGARSIHAGLQIEIPVWCDVGEDLCGFTRGYKRKSQFGVTYRRAPVVLREVANGTRSLA